MLRLKCLNCGLTVPYKGSEGDLCPRCLVRAEQAVGLLTVSDQPSTESRRSMGRLRMSSSVQGERHTLILSGELEIGSAEMLEQAIADACSAGAKELVLDLGGIEFMDSTGLNAILRGRLMCEEHECEYCLTPAQRPIQHVFEVTGLREKLRFRRAG